MLAKWDGSSWSPLGSGANAFVRGLASGAGGLYAVGSFNLLGGQACNSIGKWDGTSWNALGSGTPDYINAALEHNGKVYVGGAFSFIGGIACEDVGVWDGSSWSAMGNGLQGDWVKCMTLYNNQLHVGGIFEDPQQVVLGSVNIAKWSPILAHGEELSLDQFVSIYPNPAKDEFSIESSHRLRGEVSIIDLAGKVCKTQPINAYSATLDISDLEPGLYHVRIQSGQQSLSRKLFH